MSVIQNNLLLAGDDAYNLTRSLRFRQSASAYLNRTPASSPTSNQKGTFSFWFKRGLISFATEQWFFSSGATSLGCYIPTADRLGIEYFGGSYLVTTQVFRDPSAWYHVVIAIDSTQATASNRAKVYVNGVQVTSFSTEQYPSQNATFNWMANGQACFINQIYSSGRYFDGYMAEWNYIDGQALTPSSFGANSPTTGVWQPKKYAGTYGTNGFYLPFSDNASTTTLGSDFSGNGNNWTTNNISLTAGSTYDSMTDVPTLTSATASNYCVLNPIGSDLSFGSITNANLTATTNYKQKRGTFAVNTGKYYWEVLCVSDVNPIPAYVIGVVDVSAAVTTNPFTSGSGAVFYYANNGNKYINGTSSSYGATYTANDVIGVALDMDAGTVTFYKNNTSQGSVTLHTATASFVAFLASGSSDPNNTVYAINFGQRPFSYTPPTGFVALNTFNLPTPTIGATASTQANKYFDIATYNNATVVSGLGFAPDFVWHKSRNQTYNHYLYDKVRGTGAKGLNSNTTSVEGANDALGIVSFDSTGVTYSSDAGLSQTNAVGWFWKGGGTGVSNTAGSITSTVSANTSAGFSVVTYTGNGTSGNSWGHGLGVKPNFVIIKNRGTTDFWSVYHSSLGATKKLHINTTDAQITSGNYANTEPTSTVFTVSSGSEVNANGNTYVAYCFSEVAGYSRFGSYTGNGSTDGTFVYLGFRPRYIMVKNYLNAQEWIVIDSARNTFNVAGDYLRPNSSGAENSGSSPSTSSFVDFLSNGIKFRNNASSSGYTNQSGQTYIYAAFAEFPFKYSLAR